MTIDDHETTHCVEDVETLWQGGLGSLALSASAIRHQDAVTQAAIKAASEKRAAAYKTAAGLELPSRSGSARVSDPLGYGIHTSDSLVPRTKRET